MAVTWGTVVGSSSGGQMKLGYEWTQAPATVVAGTTSVTLTLDIWIWTKWSVSDSSNTFACAGTDTLDSTADVTISTTSDSSWSTSNQKLIRTVSRTFAPSYTATTSSSFTATLSGVEAVGTSYQATVTGSWTTAMRPYTAPTAPTDVAGTRVSDSQINVTWTSNATSGAPYTTYNLQRYDNVSAAWSTVKTGLTSASYSDTTTAVNRSYKYRVYVANTGGSATSAESALVYTTPAAPSNATATKSVSDIVITWDDNSGQEEGFKVYESQDGGAYALLATVGAGVETYTHTSPSGSVTHRYQVKAYRGSLYSAASTTATIQLLAAPNAPTGLALSGGVSVFDAVNLQAVVWQHNPVDGTAQTAKWRRYREQGTSDWLCWDSYNFGTATISIATPGVVTCTNAPLETGDLVQFTTTGALPTGITASTWYYAIRVTADTFRLATSYANAIAGTALATSGTQSGTHTLKTSRMANGDEGTNITAGTLTNGKTWEFQAKTAGQYATTPYWSPWSSTLTFATSTIPTATINSPADAATLTSPSVTIEWAYYDAESTAQSARKVTVYASDGTTALWSQTVSDDAVSATPAYTLADGVTYVLGVKVRDGDGLWSAEDTVTVDVDYDEPMTPTIEVAYNVTTGSATITITNPAPTAGEPDVVYNDVYRVIGGTAALVAGSAGPNAAVTDYIPLANGTTGYYVVAYSALPSAATSETVDLVTTGEDGWIYLNGGDGFGDVVAVRYGPEWKDAPERDKTLHTFASTGEDNYPVEFTSSAKARQVQVSAYCYDTATRDAIIAFGLAAGPHFLRDCKGRHFQCALSGVSVAETHTSKIAVGFTATRTRS